MKIKENEKKKNDKYLNIARELKTRWYMKMTVVSVVIGLLRTLPEGWVKGTERHRKSSASGDHPKYKIIKIGQNNEKRPGHLWRLAVTQTSVKEHQLMLV